MRSRVGERGAHRLGDLAVEGQLLAGEGTLATEHEAERGDNAALVADGELGPAGA